MGPTKNSYFWGYNTNFISHFSSWKGKLDPSQAFLAIFIFQPGTECQPTEETTC